MDKIYLATNNIHKKLELEAILGKKLSIAQDDGIDFDPEETGLTFIENAIIKAKALYDVVKMPVLADDSGLCVNALGGAPGIYTARFGKDEGVTDQKGQNNLLLKKLENASDRSASFICSFVLYINDNRIYVVQEEMPGSISKSEYGLGGFGYDPIFIAEGQDKTNAELGDEFKNKFSHRAKAARKISKLMEDL